MSSMANRSKRMLMHSLDYNNNRIRLEAELDALTDAREKDDQRFKIGKTVAQALSFMTGRPELELLYNTATTAIDYFDKSEEQYLDPSDYKFFRDDITTLNKELKDYDKAKTKSDIIGFGVDLATFYKKTGGVDKDGNWMPFAEYAKNREWEEYGVKTLEQLENMNLDDKEDLINELYMESDLDLSPSAIPQLDPISGRPLVGFDPELATTQWGVDEVTGEFIDIGEAPITYDISDYPESLTMGLDEYISSQEVYDAGLDYIPYQSPFPEVISDEEWNVMSLDERSSYLAIKSRQFLPKDWVDPELKWSINEAGEVIDYEGYVITEDMLTEEMREVRDMPSSLLYPEEGLEEVDESTFAPVEDILGETAAPIEDVLGESLYEDIPLDESLDMIEEEKKKPFGFLKNLFKKDRDKKPSVRITKETIAKEIIPGKFEIGSQESLKQLGEYTWPKIDRLPKEFQDLFTEQDFEVLRSHKGTGEEGPAATETIEAVMRREGKGAEYYQLRGHFGGKSEDKYGYTPPETQPGVELNDALMVQWQMETGRLMVGENEYEISGLSFENVTKLKESSEWMEENVNALIMQWQSVGSNLEGADPDIIEWQESYNIVARQEGWFIIDEDGFFGPGSFDAFKRLYGYDPRGMQGPPEYNDMLMNNFDIGM
jgi:hypothetical protein